MPRLNALKFLFTIFLFDGVILFWIESNILSTFTNSSSVKYGKNLLTLLKNACAAFFLSSAPLFVNVRKFTSSLGLTGLDLTINSTALLFPELALILFATLVLFLITSFLEQTPLGWEIQEVFDTKFIVSKPVYKTKPVTASSIINLSFRPFDAHTNKPVARPILSPLATTVLYVAAYINCERSPSVLNIDGTNFIVWPRAFGRRPPP